MRQPVTYDDQKKRYDDDNSEKRAKIVPDRIL